VNIPIAFYAGLQMDSTQPTQPHSIWDSFAPIEIAFN
jgi:hypothetical protein